LTKSVETFEPTGTPELEDQAGPKWAMLEQEAHQEEKLGPQLEERSHQEERLGPQLEERSVTGRDLL